MPPGGYGAPPPGGGYGAQSGPADPLGATAAAPAIAAPIAGAPAAAAPTPQALFAVAAPAVAVPAPVAASPAAARDSGPGAGGSAATPIVQVRCPSCGMNTMATPGQPSVCFSCGQPLPMDLTKGGGPAPAPFAPTGAFGVQPLVPPPNPYASPGTGSTSATIRSPSGQFVIRGGAEVRVGRDPAQCSIFLSEPRVSGVHATLKFESGQLVVRDESSNNGTWVSGARLAPGVWTMVPAGTALRFGPVEFAVQLDA
jgi:hypothetical protein